MSKNSCPDPDNCPQRQGFIKPPTIKLGSITLQYPRRGQHNLQFWLGIGKSKFGIGNLLSIRLEISTRRSSRKWKELTTKHGCWDVWRQE
jgi:hypothetical protein